MSEQDKRDALILANVRRIAKRTRMPNWVLAMETFGFGSTSAHKMCARLGLDPESSSTHYTPMMQHIEASNVSDWIHVFDRLPTWEDGRVSRTKVYVMARTVGGVEKECGFYLAGPDGAWDDYDYSPLHRVTHWKPIKEQA